MNEKMQAYKNVFCGNINFAKYSFKQVKFGEVAKINEYLLIPRPPLELKFDEKWIIQEDRVKLI